MLFNHQLRTNLLKTCKIRVRAVRLIPSLKIGLLPKSELELVKLAENERIVFADLLFLYIDLYI